MNATMMQQQGESPPTWNRPRTPLAPARLAALANALGVSTPTPATHNFQGYNGNTHPASATTSNFSDHPWRSPSPSLSVTHSSYTQTTSKYMLHVIPPMSLPHDSDSSGQSEYTPAPSHASGYHTQFRRGTLVPMHSTLQAQLGAIAREYALPSTTGMILYLVTATQVTPSASSLRLDDTSEEPGPRLSPEIWQHLWTRVLRTDEATAPRSPNPQLFGLGLSSSTSSDKHGFAPMRPLETPQPLRLAYPITPSPSTPSSIRSHTKSAPPSASSIQSDPETPDTSSSSHNSPPDSDMRRADSLDLPGLRSPSLIPILAKVEFDIDRRKATWLEPWLRSRKTNHAKRAESRVGMTRQRAMSTTDDGTSSVDDGSSEDREKRAPIDLKLVGRMQTASPALSFALSVAENSPELVEEPEAIDSYAPLAEDTESELEEYEDHTTRSTTAIDGEGDPLGDVFGTDADTWADLSESNRDSKRPSNPNVVPLALDGSALSEEVDDPDRSIGDETMMEEKEVRDILNKMNHRPSLVVSIPTSPPTSSKRRSSPTTATARKHIPPPLVLHPIPTTELHIPPIPSPMSAGSVSLAYLHNTPSSSGTAVQPKHDKPFDEVGQDENELQGKYRSPQEERRAGGVFDDLDLGLDEDDTLEDFDFEDPEDRRQSQFLMRAKLDEIERTLAQFSPRPFTAEIDGDLPGLFGSKILPPSHTVSPLSNSAFPPTPGLAPAAGASWPAVPYSSINAQEDSPKAQSMPSPPQLAVNGVSTSAPRAYYNRDSSASISKETELRRRQQDDEDAQYPERLPPSFARRAVDSPVIPMSPDPFGRFSSSPPEVPPGHNKSHWDDSKSPVTPAYESSSRPSDASERPATTSSRFSADSITSITGADAGKSSPLISVKSIKKLWRKSNKSSVSSISGLPPPPTPTLDRSAFMDKQDAMTTRSTQPSPVPPRSLQPSPAPPRPPQPPAPARPQPARNPSAVNQLQFDQQSPYPTFSKSPSSQPQVLSVPSKASSSSSRPASPSLPTPPLPADKPEKKERNSVRKSILKWKSSGNLQKESSGEPARSRRPSVLSFTGRGSTSSDLPPPSPAIPDSFNIPEDKRSRVGAPKMTPSSSVDSNHSSRLHQASSPPSRGSTLDSPPFQPSSPSTQNRDYARSVASRDSQDSRPSFDTSQFEMISPVKPNGGRASYPYHGLNEES